MLDLNQNLGKNECKACAKRHSRWSAPFWYDNRAAYAPKRRRDIPGRPKTLRTITQDAPKTALKTASRWPQDAPNRSRRSQNGPRRPTESLSYPKSPPRAAEPPLPTSILQHFGDDFGTVWRYLFFERFWKVLKTCPICCTIICEIWFQSKRYS